MSALELPRLSFEDVSLICEERLDEVDEGVREIFSVTPLIASIRAGDVCHAGLKMTVAISEVARSVLWGDVQEEIDRRAQDEADEYAEAHPESPESAHGVASLFRDSHR